MPHRMEGLHIALEMERRGRGLYERALHFAEQLELRTLLHSLIADEERHHRFFEGLLNRQGAKPLTPDENALIAAKAAEFFFPGGLMEIAMEGGLLSPRAFLMQAIQSEKDSIAFYMSFLSHVTAEDQAAILAIIKEEEAHLAALLSQQQWMEETT